MRAEIFNFRFKGSTFRGSEVKSQKSDALYQKKPLNPEPLKLGTSDKKKRERLAAAPF